MTLSEESAPDAKTIVILGIYSRRWIRGIEYRPIQYIDAVLISWNSLDE